MPTVGRKAPNKQHTQSVHFAKEFWTKQKSKDWCKDNSYYTDGYDERETEHAWRQYDPEGEKFRYRTKVIKEENDKPSISLIIGFPKEGDNNNMRNRAFKSPFKRGAPRYEVQNKTNGPTEVYLYDEIGWLGIDAETFVKDLKAIKGDILIRINSPGGSVFDGMAIANTISERKDQTDTVVDGLAASAASYIAMSGDTVRMNQGAFLMVHEPWSLVIGSAEDMRKEADLLDKVNEQIANFYVRKSGKTLAEIKETMQAETWFTGQEAKDFGLVDEVFEDETVENHFDLSVFNNVPESLIHETCDGDTPTRKKVEQALRNVGYSRQEAKAFYSEGKKALSDNELSDDDWAAIKRLTKKMRG